MQAEDEASVWEVALLPDGRALADLYDVDAPPVRAELAVEALAAAAPAAPREDGSLEDEGVIGEDLRPVHAAHADAAASQRASLLTQPDVCSQARPRCSDGRGRCDCCLPGAC